MSLYLRGAKNAEWNVTSGPAALGGLWVPMVQVQAPQGVMALSVWLLELAYPVTGNKIPYESMQSRIRISISHISSRILRD